MFSLLHASMFVSDDQTKAHAAPTGTNKDSTFISLNNKRLV